MVHIQIFPLVPKMSLLPFICKGRWEGIKGPAGRMCYVCYHVLSLFNLEHSSYFGGSWGGVLLGYCPS